MPIAVTCPTCKYSGRVPDQALGRRIKCPKCTKPFLVEADGAAPLPAGSDSGALTPPPGTFEFGEGSGKTPKPVVTPEPSDGDSHEEIAEGARLPWFYGFLETYAKVAMILGIVIATLGLILYLTVATIALAAGGREGIVLAVITMVGAIIAYVVGLLAIMLLTALALMLVDMAKNMRQVRHTIEERSKQ